MFKRKKLDLQIFAEGGEGTAQATESAEKTGETGVNGSDPGNQTAEAPDPEKEFEELIRTKFKEQYNSRVNKTVRDRLKNSKKAEEKLNSIAPILNNLSDKYGIGSDDIEGIINAMNEDDSYWEAEAYEKGISVDSLKQMKRIQHENARLQAEQQRREEDERANAQYYEWMRQAEQLQRVFPGFDIQYEINNTPEFKELLSKGVSVEAAYKVTHMDDIITTGMKTAYDKAKDDAAASIRSRQNIPELNGMSSQAAAESRIDVNKLTKAQMEEYINRALHGEKITFK